MSREDNIREFLYLKLTLIVGIILFSIYFVIPPQYRLIFQEYTAKQWIHLGLDLKGGSQLIYRLSENVGSTDVDRRQVVQETIAVISQRIYNSGIVREPRIQNQGENEILIQLPGLTDQETEEIKNIITRLGRLEFRLRASPNVGSGVDEQTERRKKATQKNYVTPKGYRWYKTRKRKGRSRRSEVDEMLIWVDDGRDFTGKKFKRFFYDWNSAGQRVIAFELKDEYKFDFKEFTGKYKGENLAIIFNNQVYAAPLIKSQLPGSGIMEGFALEELKELKEVLLAGSLDIKPECIGQNTVGPSLGRKAVALGIKACLIGLSLVFIFMIFYYRLAGIIASLALMINILIILATLVITGETLTLPGIAGIILTVGMSVDANIIIFERIREEQDKQKIVRDAIISGYKQAFRTIFDANLTTLLTALILLTVATGSIKGFAMTLSVGVIASFFTAIFVTKTIFYFMMQNGMIKPDGYISMMRFVKSPRFDFMKWRTTAAVMSLILIAGGMYQFYQRGPLNYGIDLKGGIRAQISLVKPLTSSEVRQRLPKQYRRKVQIQEIYRERPSEAKSGQTQAGGYEFDIRFQNIHETEIAKIQAELARLDRLYKQKLEEKQTENRLIKLSEEELQEELRKGKAERRRLAAQRDQATTAEEKAAIQAQIERTFAYSKKLQEEIEKKKQRVRRISAKLEMYSESRGRLLKKKDELSGIGELKKMLQKAFAKELAPEPFTNIKEKSDDYYSIDVNFREPLFWQDIYLKIKALKAEGQVDDAILKTEEPKQKLFQEPYTDWQALNNGQIPSNLQQSFTKHQHSLSTLATIEQQSSGKQWLIKDGQAFYQLEREKDQLVVYQIKKLRTCTVLVQGSNLSVILKQLNQVFKERNEVDGTINNLLSNPFPRFEGVSGLVAQKQQAKAWRAIILSLLVIIFYITFRWSWQLRYGLGAVVALAHDVLFTLGAIAVAAHFGLVNVEIDLSAIAAILTIIGYSLNDTIVIFDRIRENLALPMTKKDLEETRNMNAVQKFIRTLNISINQSLGRTLLTSLTTLLVLLTIFVLNYQRGGVMEGFSYTLLVGVIVGTYSSIFVASPVVLFLQKSQMKDRR